MTALPILETSTDHALPQRVKPFLKWAGGKFRVLDEILPRLPRGDRLIEPFAGSAAVSLNAGFECAQVSDYNSDLANLYRIVRDRPDDFLEELRKLFLVGNEKDTYLSLRNEFNESLDAFRRSVIFTYMNRHGFNGLCRYNSKGIYNVPFGRYKNPHFPEAEVVKFHKRSQKFKFSGVDFETAMSEASAGDVIYCDPPYVPLSATSNFTAYSRNAFGFDQQKRLAGLSKKCAKKGVPVLISNHDTPDARALYKGAKIYSFPVRRYISSNASTRGDAQEILALYLP